MKHFTSFTFKTKNWRVIPSGYKDPYVNMAVDEALLESYKAGSCPPTLRVYGWSPRAFSFGYAQDPEANFDIDACRSQGVPFVKRVTGGGVLFHSRDISYSITCSLDDIGISDRRVRSYEILCLFLINAYRMLGLDPGYAHRVPGYIANAWKAPAVADFCFASHEKYDIAVGNRKIGGNAQKRSATFIMQHGSIPLEDTLHEAAPFLKYDIATAQSGSTSLDKLVGRTLNFAQAQDLLLRSFYETFKVCGTWEGLSDTEKRTAEQLADKKYRTDEWNMGARHGMPQAAMAQ